MPISQTYPPTLPPMLQTPPRGFAAPSTLGPYQSLQFGSVAVPAMAATASLERQFGVSVRQCPVESDLVSPSLTSMSAGISPAPSWPELSQRLDDLAIHLLARERAVESFHTGDGENSANAATFDGGVTFDAGRPGLDAQSTPNTFVRSTSFARKDVTFSNPIPAVRRAASAFLPSPPLQTPQGPFANGAVMGAHFTNSTVAAMQPMQPTPTDSPRMHRISGGPCGMSAPLNRGTLPQQQPPLPRHNAVGSNNVLASPRLSTPRQGHMQYVCATPPPPSVSARSDLAPTPPITSRRLDVTPLDGEMVEAATAIQEVLDELETKWTVWATDAGQAKPLQSQPSVSSLCTNSEWAYPQDRYMSDGQRRAAGAGFQGGAQARDRLTSNFHDRPHSQADSRLASPSHAHRAQRSTDSINGQAPPVFQWDLHRNEVPARQVTNVSWTAPSVQQHFYAGNMPCTSASTESRFLTNGHQQGSTEGVSPRVSERQWKGNGDVSPPCSNGQLVRRHDQFALGPAKRNCSPRLSIESGPQALLLRNLHAARQAKARFTLRSIWMAWSAEARNSRLVLIAAAGSSALVAAAARLVMAAWRRAVDLSRHDALAGEAGLLRAALAASLARQTLRAWRSIIHERRSRFDGDFIVEQPGEFGIYPFSKLGREINCSWEESTDAFKNYRSVNHIRLLRVYVAIWCFYVVGITALDLYPRTMMLRQGMGEHMCGIAVRRLLAFGFVRWRHAVALRAHMSTARRRVAQGISVTKRFVFGRALLHSWWSACTGRHSRLIEDAARRSNDLLIRAVTLAAWPCRTVAAGSIASPRRRRAILYAWATLLVSEQRVVGGGSTAAERRAISFLLRSRGSGTQSLYVAAAPSGTVFLFGLSFKAWAELAAAASATFTRTNKAKACPSGATAAVAAGRWLMRQHRRISDGTASRLAMAAWAAEARRSREASRVRDLERRVDALAAAKQRAVQLLAAGQASDQSLRSRSNIHYTRHRHGR